MGLIQSVLEKNPLHGIVSYMKKIKTVTLGCKVNQYESRYLLEGLYQQGYVDAAADETPDVIVINTCTVTADSDAKSRHIIRKLHRDYPAARQIIMGCWASRNPEIAAQLAQEAGNDSAVLLDKSRLGEWLLSQGCPRLPVGIGRFSEHTRAFVKVQDGCRQFCSYCIIPHVRNRLSSRAPEEVKTEIERLIQNGYKEIVLTGIHLGFYGEGFENSQLKNLTLADLAACLTAIDADFRFRISSLESHEVSDALLTLMRDNPEKICPHLHISMQSGSDRILKAMNRPSTSQQYLERCRRAKEFVPDIALTTDVIVGFPGETDDDFSQTLAVCREAGFSKIHIFRYSQREGTPAAEMENQIPAHIKRARAVELAKLEADLRRAYFKNQAGKSARVLVEEFSNGRVTGATERYIPVKMPGSELNVGQFLTVTLSDENVFFPDISSELL